MTALLITFTRCPSQWLNLIAFIELLWNSTFLVIGLVRNAFAHVLHSFRVCFFSVRQVRKEGNVSFAITNRFRIFREFWSFRILAHKRIQYLLRISLNNSEEVPKWKSVLSQLPFSSNQDTTRLIEPLTVFGRILRDRTTPNCLNKHVLPSSWAVKNNEHSQLKRVTQNKAEQVYILTWFKKM